MSQARGVFALDFVSELGFPLVVAIASDGRRVCEREVFPFEDEDAVIDEVWDELDTVDPMLHEDAA